MKKCWFLAGAFGLIAAIVYICSTAGYAFPGESAHLMAVWRGLVCGSDSPHPLMAIFAKAFGAGNALAPICGIAAVVMFFRLVAAFVFWRVSGENLVQHRNAISLVAAAAATVVFLLTPAVRSAATHLEPRMFDFTWALICFSTALPFFHGSRGRSLFFAPVLGVMVAMGFCDSALFLAFMPFFFALVVMMALRHGRRPYVSILVFAVVWSVAVLVAIRLFGIEFTQLVKSVARELNAYHQVPGWIFVLLFTTVPFVVALFSTGKAFGEKPGLVQWLFHVALSFAAILAIATPLSPSAILEPYGILPVVTSAFAAAVAGYLVAYWWMNRRRAVGLVSGGVLAFVLTVTCVWNLFSFDGDAGDFADKIARRILADLGSRRWLVTDGLLDDHLKLVAAEEGREIDLISLARDLDEDYIRELDEIVKAENIGGSKNGVLRRSLELGILPFVQDWLSSDPSVVKDVAIFGAPDIWYSAGLTPVPELLFFGADESVVPDWTYWKELDAILAAPKGWGSYHDRKVSDPVARLRFNLRRHVGFVANNRGVYLQDKKQDDEAFKMYELVLNEIDRDNICAIFNEVAMVGQNHPQAKKKKNDLERMLKAAVEDKSRRYLLWRLGTYYGYIRNPDAFVRLGHAWARSGRPGDALTQIRRAIDFVPTDRRSTLLNMMAALYASENDQKKSRKIYEAILEKNGRDHDALIGLMRLSVMEGDVKNAIQYLQRATEGAPDDNRKKIELAMLSMMKNELGRAKDLLKKVTDADPKNMQAWSLLAAVAMQQIDAAKTDREKDKLTKELENQILPAMEKQAGDRFDYSLMTTKGFLLLRKGAEKRKEARDAFVAATRTRPDVSATHDMVLGLDISLDDKANAEQHAKEVLRRNRKAPLANYVMGSLALGRGNYDGAEAYLRIAADAPQPVLLALNDLAETLRRKKNFSEAEKYARKATEKSPGLYVAWETLGAILMDANRDLDEAEACIRKACELSKDKNGNEADIRMLVSLARVQVRRSDVNRARVTIRKVRSRIGELSDFERDEFEKIEKSVKH